MSMSEPLLPHPADDDERATPAEPDEPDVLPPDDAETGGTAPDATGDPAAGDGSSTSLFRTPTAGDRLSSDDLEDESGA